MNPLLAILNPRTIPEVLHLIEKIRGYDKLWIKNFPQVEAYTKLRNWFLEHTEYSHLVLLIDDVLITQNEFDILREDLHTNDYQILAGIGNVSYLRLEEYSPVMDTLPTMEADTYHFLTKAQLDDFLAKGEYIKQVMFEGFSLPFIRRDVVEMIPFRGPDSVDTHFATDCAAKGVATYVDLRAKMFHLKWRLGLNKYENMNVDVNVELRPQPKQHIVFEYQSQ